MKCYNEFLYEVNIFYSYQLVCFYNLIWGWGLHSAAQNGGLANSSWQVEPVEGAHGPGVWGLGKEGGGGALAIYWAATLIAFCALMLRCAISTLSSFYLGIRCLDIHIRSYLALVWRAPGQSYVWLLLAI